MTDRPFNKAMQIEFLPWNLVDIGRGRLNMADGKKKKKTSTLAVWSEVTDSTES